MKAPLTLLLLTLAGGGATVLTRVAPLAQVNPAPASSTEAVTAQGYRVLDQAWSDKTLYVLAAKPGSSQRRDPDGTPFTESQVALFALAAGEEPEQLTLGSAYLHAAGHGAITVDRGRVLAFVTHKVQGGTYDMTGTLWSVDPDLVSNQSVRNLFSGANCGWFPYFVGPDLHHFNLGGNFHAVNDQVRVAPLRPEAAERECLQRRTAKAAPPAGLGSWSQPQPPAQTLERVQGPFPESDRMAMTEVSTEGGSTFIRIVSKGKGTVHFGDSTEYVVRSGQRVYHLLSLDGGRRTLPFPAGTSMLLEFERFPLDAPFDLLEGDLAGLQRTDTWHLRAVNLAGNGRDTRTLGGAPVDVRPADPGTRLRLVRYEERSSEVGLTLHFSAGGVWGPTSEDTTYFVSQDGKTLRMRSIEGPNRKEFVNTQLPDYGKVKYVVEAPEATCWFEPFDPNRPFDLIEGRKGTNWNFKGVDLVAAKAAFPQYLDRSRQAFQALRSRDACEAWQREFGLNDPDGQVQKLAQMRQELMLRELQDSGLTARFGFKQGEIGKRWVPPVSYSTSSSDTVYINNEPVTSTKYGTSGSSGYDEKVEGYTAVYGLKNTSASAYLAELTVSGTATFNPTVVDKAAWSGDESRRRTTKQNAIRIVKRVLVKPGGDYKDQVIMGEEQPADFKIEVNDFWKVDPAWVARFERALGGEMGTRAQARAVQPLLEELGQDTRVNHPNGWANALRERLGACITTIAAANLADIRKDVSTTVLPGADFDPDFPSEVKVQLKNLSNYGYGLTVRKPDGTNDTVTVAAHSSAFLVANVQHIERASLSAEIVGAIAPPGRLFLDTPEPVAKPLPAVRKKPAAKKT